MRRQSKKCRDHGRWDTKRRGELLKYKYANNDTREGRGNGGRDKGE